MRPRAKHLHPKRYFFSLTPIRANLDVYVADLCSFLYELGHHETAIYLIETCIALLEIGAESDDLSDGDRFQFYRTIINLAELTEDPGKVECYRERQLEILNVGFTFM